MVREGKESVARPKFPILMVVLAACSTREKRNAKSLRDEAVDEICYILGSTISILRQPTASDLRVATRYPIVLGGEMRILERNLGVIHVCLTHCVGRTRSQ